MIIMDFTKQDKVTIDFFEKTLADPDFYAKEVAVLKTLHMTGAHGSYCL